MAVLILATGIATNLIVFAAVNGALIRALPFFAPDRLVALDSSINGKPVGVSWAEIDDLGRSPVLFEATAAYTSRTWARTDHTSNGVDVILSGMVTLGFFRVLHPNPEVGVTSTSDNEPRVVILSYALWQKRYHGDPTVTTRSLWLNEGALSDYRCPSEDFRFPDCRPVPRTLHPTRPQRLLLPI